MVQVALLAMEVAEAALRTLACTSAALDIQEQRITPLVKPRDAVQPVQPEVPQLLPSIHTLWAPLVQTLKVSALLLSAFPVYWHTMKLVGTSSCRILWPLPYSSSKHGI